RNRPIPNPAHLLTPYQLSVNFVEELSKRGKQEQVRINIKNLSKTVTATALKKLLEPFGEVVDVNLEESDNYDRVLAKVHFERPPHNISGLVRARIDGKLLDLELQKRHGDGSYGVCFADKLELGQKSAPNIFCPEFVAKSDVSIQFQESRRVIKISFRRKFIDTTIKYILEMRFQDMDKGCIQVDIDNLSFVTINLRFPPVYWRFDPTLQSTDEQKWSESSGLRRVVHIPNEDTVFNPIKQGDMPPNQNIPVVLEPVEPNPTNFASKLGKWTVIRLAFGRGAVRNLNTFAKLCKTYNLLSTDSQTILIRETPAVPRTYMDAFKDLSFEVRYMLESALSFNCIMDYDLTPTVGRYLCSMEPLKATMMLEHIVSTKQRIWDLEGYIAKEISKQSRISSSPRIAPPQCVYLRRIIVTPTTMHLQPPSVETSNRVVRHFSDLRDYFIRVEFSDEANNRIWSKNPSDHGNKAIYNRIFTTLSGGIKIGDRHYEFLAFSASQLRDNCSWFFCSQGGNHTVESIHKWMGDFSHIKSIPKYAARMGQCFSSTRDIANLSESEVRTIPDIEHDGHNFSDGCGRISMELARTIGIELEKETVPVAFQIRLGGAKGVLALYPSFPGKRVEIRPSMIKFEVNHKVLEVIKTSAFIPSYLNRQIIILLSAIGVPDKVILDLKNRMVQDLERIETDEKIAASTLAQNWDENGTSKMMIEMINAGFWQSQDPFLKNLLTLFKLHMLEELAKKAKISVPKGAYLLGVCDETKELKEGEIFVQVSSADNPTKRRIIVGKCAVVRCPCFHPGDIRIVQAVDCRSLRHLHDVVVFNTKGTRGIPNMCSGGDLDGDDFTVIWDPDIVNNIKEDKPMDFPSHNVTSNEDVKLSDIKIFFVRYAVANNLGLIANAHLALSDYLEQGPYHGKCIRLAQLHSDAVDYPKSGIPAVLTTDLKPKQYPDFMEKPSGKSYKSRRVVGKIYRECSTFRDHSKTESFIPKDYHQSFNALILVDGYEEYMKDAFRLKAEYDDEVLSLMNQYGVKSDLEIASGYIMGADIITNKREHDVRKSIISAYSIIKRRFRVEFEEEFYSADSRTISPNMQQFVERKAAAWYAVCYQNWQPGQPYTFAWVVWKHICGIASRVQKVSGLQKSSRLENLQQDTRSQSDMSQIASENSLSPRSSLSGNISKESMPPIISSAPQNMSILNSTNRGRSFYRTPEEEASRALPKTDVTFNADSVIIGPDADNDIFKTALRF
ncbi:hypothetical protein BGZ46_007836, partial [Entomortierella lignicola]